jgi:hypothetical protein
MRCHRAVTDDLCIRVRTRPWQPYDGSREGRESRMYGKGLHPKPKPKRVLGRVGWGIGNSADLISGGVWRSRRVCFDGAYGLNFYL